MDGALRFEFLECPPLLVPFLDALVGAGLASQLCASIEQFAVVVEPARACPHDAALLNLNAMDCSDHFAVGTHLRSDVIGARAGLGLQINDGDLPAFAIKAEDVGLATTAFA